MIEVILFDNDGVLVDTEGLYMQACAELLAGCGVTLTPALFAEYSLTRGVSTLELALERGLVTPDQLPALHARRDDRYAALLAEGPRPNPGALALVECLSGRLTMGIVTSAARRHFEITHRHTGILRHMAFRYTREDYARSKPHPDPYLCALQGQGLDPSRCLVVEDTPRGVRSAHAAGLRCVALPNPLAPADDFELAIASITSLDQLPGLISSLDRSGAGLS